MDAEVDGEPRGGGPANSGGARPPRGPQRPGCGSAGAVARLCRRALIAAAVIDRDSAVLPGNRAMGSTPECASRFEVADTYSQINYQGRPVRVGTLSCAGLF